MKKEEISLKNTKAEILEALNQALEREKNANKVKSDPVQTEQKKKVEKAISNSKENVARNIFSDELMKKFQDLETAIAAEEAKLKELYDVEGELNHLTLVANAGKDFMNHLEQKKKERTEELEQKIRLLEEEYKKKQEELQREYDNRAKLLKMERDRENEEYNYKLKREREINNNNWEDEKKQRQEKLTAMEEEANRLLNEAKEKSGYIKELEQKVSQIPDNLEKEYQRGKKETESELKKEHQYEVELLKRDYQNKIDRQEDKIQSLQQELENERKASASLQDKMDKAYVELKELATKTVETSGVVKIIGNTSNGENKAN